MARGKNAEKVLTPEEKLAQALVPAEEQPYSVPGNWCWTRIGNISKVVGGGTPSSSVKEYYDGGTIPWITPADLSGYSEIYISSGEKNITELGLEKSSAKMLPANTVCLSTRAPIGYVVIAKNELCTNQGFKSFLPSVCYTPKYLYWYLKGNKELLESYASGTTFLELSGGKAAVVEFPLAPLSEQQRIVARIESLFAKLDEAKEKVQTVVDGFESRKAAILHKAFTGELTAQWRKDNGISKADWEHNNLGKYAGSQYGYTESASAEPIGPKFLRITDIQDGWVDWKTVPYCKISPEKKASYSLKRGDIVVARTGATTGKSYLVIDNIDAVYASYLIRVAINCDKLIGEYLYLYFQSQEYWTQISEFSSGIAQPGVNGNKLRELEVPVPPVSEQTEIVHALNIFLTKEKQAKDAAEAVLDQIDTMKKAILARAFRGELGTNDPAEESAVELLKSILN